ncbi:MAG TPA: glyceraldehyde-3-phosphate dehydrogenase [Desulfurivibrio alkaliphilus]|uniref:Glyceraldehyde-3-phosphate dehydrogenase n=1 Tax=Desulfurivibrio alkaliphilus TaxID=427923 RepID=A0A7C2THM0_9BACT|nr:glyceraldehyde-3-phosphate dehydrogenase [Desulfurivibrio alkaliphilus]
MKLGINGLGRIGKLSLWHHVSRKFFSEIVVNVGREVGTSLNDIAGIIERDSTYGRLGPYLHGCKFTGSVIEQLDEAAGSLVVNGTPVKVLRQSRDPRGIAWKENGVRLVVDTTGAFTDPTADADSPGGSLRGHLQGGAEKVILSAPFKIKQKGLEMPEDVVTTVMGINDGDYDPSRHLMVSAASCTTTCLSFMVKPLMDYFGADKFLSASMVTVHAVTGSQPVLDRVPAAGATDLRKSRSILNNIILTSTGAAKALPLVIPEMKKIGFIAESVRIPTSSGSLIILVVNFQDDGERPIQRELINSIYSDYSRKTSYLQYTEQQLVSCDIVGNPAAAAVIEARETHTRTANISVNLGQFNCSGAPDRVEVPVTQAVIYGWYDNELGSYTNMLGDRTVGIAEQLV